MIGAGMIARVAGFGFKDWLIAGLASLVLILSIICYLNLHFLFIGFEGWKPRAERLGTELVAEQNAHAVTRNSVETLTEALAVYIDDGKARRIAGLAALEAQAEKSAALRDRADAIRAELEALQPAGDQCATPDFVMGR